MQDVSVKRRATRQHRVLCGDWPVPWKLCTTSSICVLFLTLALAQRVPRTPCIKSLFYLKVQFRGGGIAGRCPRAWVPLPCKVAALEYLVKFKILTQKWSSPHIPCQFDFETRVGVTGKQGTIFPYFPSFLVPQKPQNILNKYKNVPLQNLLFQQNSKV